MLLVQILRWCLALDCFYLRRARGYTEVSVVPCEWRSTAEIRANHTLAQGWLLRVLPVARPPSFDVGVADVLLVLRDRVVDVRLIIVSLVLRHR